MSSSDPNSSILVSDSAFDIKRKINKYAKTGGGQSVEEHRANGCDLDVDVPFQYLTFFMEDDARLEEIRVKYGKGELLSGEVKMELIKIMQDFTKVMQDARKKVTNKDVEYFMSIRKIEKMPKKWLAATALADAAPESGVTLFTDRACNMQTASVQIAADLSNTRIDTRVCNQAKQQDLAKKASIQGSELPYFQLAEKTLLTDSTAIAKYLIRNGPKSETLLGGSAIAEAQIEQFVAMASSSIIPRVRTIEATVFGTKVDPNAHLEAVKALKETCKVLNGQLQGKTWFNGVAMSFADIHLFTALVPAFQLTLDAGFRKAMPELAQWFEKMSKLPVVVGRVGFVKPCMKALQPVKK